MIDRTRISTGMIGPTDGPRQLAQAAAQHLEELAVERLRAAVDEDRDAAPERPTRRRWRPSDGRPARWDGRR